jgi:hypothetical protein
VIGINWKQGTWERDQEKMPTHQILVAGDFYPRRNLEQLSIHNPAALYDDLLPILKSADLRIVNLEAPLSDRGAPIAKDGPNMRLHPATVAGLAEVPFDLACLANNHIMDYGPQALQDTLDSLGDSGIRSVGASLTPERAYAPLILEAPGLRLGVVNFCEGEDGTGSSDGPGTFGWEPDRVVRAVVELRDKADVVMVIAHVGREYAPVPPPYVQRLFRSITEAGADIIVGHHPHVPQGVEIHRGTPIVYSLGNFVFRPWGSAFLHRGLLLSVGVREGTVSGFRLIPYSIDDTGVHGLARLEREWLFRQLRTASDALADPEQVREAWNAFIDSFDDDFWREQAGGSPRQLLRAFIAALLRKARPSRDPAQKTAHLRNRFITPAHQHFLADGLARLESGRLGTSQPWAKELVQRWRYLEEPDFEPAIPSGNGKSLNDDHQ